jgi:hypothetical protein
VRPHAKDAKRRAPVRFKVDGRARTGRLAFWPVADRRPGKGPSPGSKARVVLPSGKYLSVDPEVVELIEEAK